MIDSVLLLNKLDELIRDFLSIEQYCDYDNKVLNLLEISKKLEDPSIWKDFQQIELLKKSFSQINNIVKQIDAIRINIQNTKDILQLAINENDSNLLSNLEIEINDLSKKIELLTSQKLFSNIMDKNNSYLDIQSGAGGVEAQDWAEMLLRMYLRFGNVHEFQTQLLNVSLGDIAGIKSATIKFIGEYAYGWLRTEAGVHRLVRKSPFDANHKRHTSFASIFVYPELDENINVEINSSDLRIDTYRAQGAGGQHVNKTDSAVRIKHNPTGIIVQCQSERSQHQNRIQAMKQLKAKIYEIELRKKKENFSKLEELKLDIAWSNQIRSYVLDDSRVKDLRTNVESRNPQSVLDGNIDFFIKATLYKSNIETKK